MPDSGEWQQPRVDPSGKQYLVQRLANAELTIHDLLDELARLRAQVEELQRREAT
jgi:hypothetical protein